MMYKNMIGIYRVTYDLMERDVEDDKNYFVIEEKQTVDVFANGYPDAHVKAVEACKDPVMSQWPKILDKRIQFTKREYHTQEEIELLHLFLRFFIKEKDTVIKQFKGEFLERRKNKLLNVHIDRFIRTLPELKRSQHQVFLGKNRDLLKAFFVSLVDFYHDEDTKVEVGVS